MAHVFKPFYTRPLPADAKVFNRKGKRFARFTQRGGKVIEAPLTADGEKVRVETEAWYIRFKGPDGKWKVKKGYTDRRATEEKARGLQTRLDQQHEGIRPYEEEHQRPILEHVDGFERHLESKGGTWRHVVESGRKVRRIIEGCGFKRITDITADSVESYLAEQRRGGMGAQTSNHYLRSMKGFTRWLFRSKRTGQDVCVHLSMVNPRTDQRHQRRALTDDEFARLIQAAMKGPEVEGIPGPDRAMIYVLAAWTGYRRGELASLTLRSFSLHTEPATVTVAAAYSKRRREDTIPLHPEVVGQLRDWFAARGEIDPDAPLFDLTTSAGCWRKTSKLMRDDLAAARKAWIAEAQTEAEEAEREQSDFLAYRSERGDFADFHSNRHTFITNLGRAGVPLTTAQKLARHHDPKLTASIYTHLGVVEQAAAIDCLPAPPVPGRSLYTRFTRNAHDGARRGTITHRNGWINQDTRGECELAEVVNSERLGTTRHGQEEVHPTGLEPVTFGSVDRCSIQLS